MRTTTRPRVDRRRETKKAALSAPPSVQPELQEQRNGPKKAECETRQVGREDIPPRPIRAVTALPSSATADREAEDLARFMKALGCKDPHFAQGLLQQILGASAKGGGFDLTGLLFTLAVVKSTAPKDEVEAMHRTQMAAIHAATMKAAGELARAETLAHQEVATRAVNQLARTYAAQLEVLKRYRAGAEQPLSVQNVSVSQGGQAIVTQGSAPASQEVADVLPALADARQQPIEIISEPQRELVSRPPNAEPASSLKVRRRRPERAAEE